MQMIADILLGAGALGAGFYCLVLSRRLKKFTRLENGMGSAIAVLSSQVDQMTKVLEAAQVAARESADTLEAKTARGEKVAERLELILAAMHDLPTVRVQRRQARNLQGLLPRRLPTLQKSAPRSRWAMRRFRRRLAQSGPTGARQKRRPKEAARARFVRRRVGRSDSEAA
jgi:hypothetical protein